MVGAALLDRVGVGQGARSPVGALVGVRVHRAGQRRPRRAGRGRIPAAVVPATEMGFEPQVDLRTGIKLAAEWFNAGGMNEASVTQASQNAPLAGATR